LGKGMEVLEEFSGIRRKKGTPLIEERKLRSNWSRGYGYIKRNEFRGEYCGHFG
jgi:hypothetical protein